MKKKFLMMMLAILVVLSAVGCGGKGGLTLGTGNSGGVYYTFGKTLADTAAKAETPLELEIKETPGSDENLKLLQDQKIFAAIVQSDRLWDAANGQGEFAEKPYPCVCAVAGLYTEACQIVVPADSEIDSVIDLVGKKVSLGEKSSGSRRNAEQILQVNGLTPEVMTIIDMSYSDAAKALIAGELDAFFVTAGLPTAVIKDITNKCRLIPLDDACIERITALYPGYCVCEIPANTYAGQNKGIKTVGVRACLAADITADNAQIATLLKTLFDAKDSLPLFGEALTIQSATEKCPVGFHPAAAAFYGEQGINVQENQHQK